MSDALKSKQEVKVVIDENRIVWKGLIDLPPGSLNMIDTMQGTIVEAKDALIESKVKQEVAERRQSTISKRLKVITEEFDLHKFNTEEISKENRQLTGRVKSLENQIVEFKKMLKDAKAKDADTNEALQRSEKARIAAEALTDGLRPQLDSVTRECRMQKYQMESMQHDFAVEKRRLELELKRKEEDSTYALQRIRSEYLDKIQSLETSKSHIIDECQISLNKKELRHRQEIAELKAQHEAEVRRSKFAAMHPLMMMFPEERPECTCCMDAVATVTLQPCGHKEHCVKCAFDWLHYVAKDGKVQECPKCRVPVTSYT